MSAAVTLDPESVEAVAHRVAELLREEKSGGAGMVDAAEIARRFGVGREYVYDRADDLGAVRLGDGPRARLRFDPAVVAERLEAPPIEPKPQGTARRKSTRQPSVPLLPVKT